MKLGINLCKKKKERPNNLIQLLEYFENNPSIWIYLGGNKNVRGAFFTECARYGIDYTNFENDSALALHQDRTLWHIQRMIWSCCTKDSSLIKAPIIDYERLVYGCQDFMYMRERP